MSERGSASIMRLLREWPQLTRQEQKTVSQIVNNAFGRMGQNEKDLVRTAALMADNPESRALRQILGLSRNN